MIGIGLILALCKTFGAHLLTITYIQTRKLVPSFLLSHNHLSPTNTESDPTASRATLMAVIVEPFQTSCEVRPFIFDLFLPP